MDPQTMILAALAAGAAAGAQATASEAVKDAYQGLKALIQRKFAGKPVGEIALAKNLENPKAWEIPLLKEALTEVRADQDEEILQKAQQLWALLHSQQTTDDNKLSVANYGDVQQQNIINKVDTLSINPPNG